MAWLPMYLLESDVEFLNDWLNQESDIAFLASNGRNRWIAQNEYRIIQDLKSGHSNYVLRKYSLWHIPSGPLPLLSSNSGSGNLKFNAGDWMNDKIDDPWKGWTELRTGADPATPYFGAGHPGVFHLEIRVSSKTDIPISNFQWIGNHYKIIGNGADKSTEVFWNKLRRMVKRIATHIPRCNDNKGRNEIYAFPKAYQDIKDGRPCSLN